MPRFIDLKQPGTMVDLPMVVASKKLFIWEPTDLVSTPGRVILIAFAPWSTYDLRILDSLSEILQREGYVQGHVGILDLDTIGPDEIETCFPDLQRPSQTPFVSVWNDGKVISTAWGWRAKGLLKGYYPTLQIAFESYLAAK